MLPIAILLLGMPGCRSVEPSDLTGTWVVKDASRQALPAGLQKASAKIVMESNGRFSASDIPALFYFPGQHEARLETGSGDWKIVSREGGQQVQLNLRVIEDWNKNELPFGAQLDVSRTGTSVNLFYFVAIQIRAKESILKRQTNGEEVLCTRAHRTLIQYSSPVARPRFR